MARKRPRLIPIIDAGIVALFGPSHQQWARLNAALREKVDGEQTFHELLIALREQAGILAHISALRVLDVAAWMQWKDESGGVEPPKGFTARPQPSESSG
jgi:hypothetical protein